MRRLGVLFAVVGLLTVGAATASASCAPVSTVGRIGPAAGAFVGTVESVRSEGMGGANVFTFRLERVFKGSFGDRVEVRDEYPSSTISLRPAQGDRVALMVKARPDGFVANDCLRSSEEALEDATRTLCRAKGTPTRRYRRRPAEPGLRYGVRPRVIGCGLTGETSFELVGYRLGRRGRTGTLCLDVALRGAGVTFGCGDNRVAGGGRIDATGQYRDDDRRLLTGSTDGFVDAVRVEYDLDGSRARIAAAHELIDDRRVLRALRVKRAFGFYVVEVPPRATNVRVTAIALFGTDIGTAGPRFR